MKWFLTLALGGVASLTCAQSYRLTMLGDLPGGSFDSRATGVSGDGTVVVGQSVGAQGAEACRWHAGGIQGLGDLAGAEFFSRAYAVSSDGKVVVGVAIDKVIWGVIPNE